MKRMAWVAIGVLMAASVFAQELPFESDSMRIPKLKTGGTVLIKGGRVLTVTKGTFEKADIYVRNGKIAKIAPNISVPAGTAVIDATGKVVSPGIVDAHIHRGSFDTNEGSDSITAEVRIGDVLNPNAKSIWQALAGGETTGLILHGSANSIGGQSQVVKLKYRAPVEQLPVPDAPRMIKFALGENVTRSGSTTATRYPRTRMGVQQLYRRAFTQAREYMQVWDDWNKSDKKGPMPRKDLRLETLADILRKKIWVQCHSYRADEMLMMVRMSQEFGFKIGAMQHGLESYKIAPELAKAGVGVSIFVDNWSFKIEGYDGIPFNAMICQKAGVNVSINTDGTGGVPSIAIDAAKPMRYGGLSETQALAMVTINPARQLGVAHRTGSLEVGKDGDIVIWDGHPLSVYSKTNMTLIEGEVYFQALDAFGLRSQSTYKTTLDANKKTPPLRIAQSKSGYVIRGATVHTVSGKSLPNTDVFVSAGKIQTVGAKVKAPAGTTIVDGRGLHVYPGFIDAGSSMGLAEISGIGQMVDTTELGSMQADLTAHTAIQLQSEHFPVARMGGVLSTLVRPSGSGIPGQASLVNTFGWTPEQKFLGKSLLMVTLPGGGGGFGGADDHGHAEEDCCGEDESARFDLLGNDLMGGAAQGQGPGGGQGGGGGASVDDIENAINAAQAYFKKRSEDPKTPKNLPYEALRPYLEGKEKVLISVNNAASIRRAIALAEKHKLNIVLSGANEAWKVAKLLAEKKIPVIINTAGRATLGSNNVSSEWDPYDAPWANAALLQKAGVKFCFQSNSNSEAFNLAVRVGQACANGLKREQAVRAITLSAAEILGVANRLGSIDKGKQADLVITDGDPFELTTNIVGVFVNGVPRPVESRFTRLRDQWLARQTGQ